MFFYEINEILKQAMFKIMALSIKESIVKIIYQGVLSLSLSLICEVTVLHVYDIAKSPNGKHLRVLHFGRSIYNKVGGKNGNMYKYNSDKELAPITTHAQVSESMFALLSTGDS